MNNLIIPLKDSQLINNDWQQKAIAIRNRLVNQKTELKYLLSSEVNHFFEYELDNNRLILYKLLWNTGIRIGEALALKVNDITFDDSLTSYITVKTLKLKKTEYRSININSKLAHELKIYINTNKLKLHEKMFKITQRTVQNWLKETENKASKNSVIFPITITPKVFRHSYAIHLLYSGISEKIISKNLGHKSFKTTEIYIDILAIETSFLREIVF